MADAEESSGESLLLRWRKGKAIEKNLALKLFARLRKNSEGEPLTDVQLRKLSGMCQMDIDIGAEQLEAAGMIKIDRTYSLVEG